MEDKIKSPFDILTDEENQSFYNHLMSIWLIIPDKVKERFKREQQCSLCNDCKDYLIKLQNNVKESKLDQQRIKEAQRIISEQQSSGFDTSTE